MIGNITYIGTLESLTNYHFKKIEEGEAEKLYSQGIDDYSKNSVEASFRAVSHIDDTLADPYVHLSLNFPVEDSEILTNDKMIEITKECLDMLGYGDQPVFVVRHYDQEHPHVHIISHSLKDNGTRVSRNRDFLRLMDINRSLEKKHGLKIVSSIRNDLSKEQVKEVELNKSADYKNYLTQSVKQVMSYKPRRIGDIQAVLESKYGIESFITEKKDFKGISFAVTDAVKGRYIEEKGTLAISGSDLSRNFSFPKIKDTIDFNFKNSQKYYNKLLSFESMMKREIEQFDKINFKDFNQFNTNVEIINKGNDFLFLDKKSRNIYNVKDLKNLDISKITLEATKFSFKDSQLRQISLEALNSYKQEIKAQGFTSEFTQKIYNPERIFDFVEKSRTFQKYSVLISDVNREEITNYLKEKNNDVNGWAEEIKRTEVAQREFDVSTYVGFLNENSLPFIQIFNNGEPLAFDKQLLIKGMRNVAETIERSKENEKPAGEKKQKLPEYQVAVNKNLFFVFDNTFDVNDLKDDYRREFEKLINKNYGIDIKNEAFRLEVQPENVLKFLNERGIKVEEQGNKIEAKIVGFNEPFLLKQIEQDFLKPVLDEQQKVETNKELIETRIAIDEQNWYKVSQNLEILPEKEIQNLEKNESWTEWNKEKENQTTLNKLVSELRKEFGFEYRSDLANYAKENSELFIKALQQKGGDSAIDVEKIKEFTNKFSTSDNIKKLENEERKTLKVNLEKVLKFEHPEKLLALMLYKSDKNGYFTEKTGKYLQPVKGIIPDKELEGVIGNNNVFKFYSPLLRDIVNEIATEEQGRIQIPDKIVMLYTIKDYLSPNDFERIREVAEKNYIDYYYNKCFDSVDDTIRMEYLNSKGIRIESISEGINLSLINSSNTIQKDNNIDVNQDLQNRILSFIGEGNENKAKLTFKISAGIENNNHKSIAYDLKKNGLTPKDIFLTSVDHNHKRNIAEETRNINNKSDRSLSLGDLAQNLLTFQKMHLKKPKMKKGKGKSKGRGM